MVPPGVPLWQPTEQLDGVSHTLRASLEELAVALATDAGRFIREQRPRQVTVSQTKSTVLDVVTEMDTRCERLLREALARHRPDDGVLGEEGGLTTGGGRRNGRRGAAAAGARGRRAGTAQPRSTATTGA